MEIKYFEINEGIDPYEVVLPPQLIQQFNADLLKTPVPMMRDSTKDLWRMYEYINRNLRKKVKGDELIKKYERMEKKFLELYERAKVKEKELEKEARHHTQMPFYFFRNPDICSREVYRRFKFRT